MATSRPSDPAAEAASTDSGVLATGVTVELLKRYRAGDTQALEALLERCLPPLRRWARGRLPDRARGAIDTVDVVQDAMVQTLRRLDQFEPRHVGALQAYLRQAVSNRIRDEVRRAAREPAGQPIDERQADPGPSPLERVIGSQAVGRYERALAGLRPQDREAIVARLELQQSYAEVAEVLGKPSPDAARVAVMRAMKRLIEAMGHEG